MNATDNLIHLLRRREVTIADHSWRDRHSVAHLQALKQVSEEIAAWPAAQPGPIDLRLRHFLSNASFAKALIHLEQACGK